MPPAWTCAQLSRCRTRAIATLVVAVVATPHSVSAAGFAAARFGGEHGNVTESNATALYYNPGALGFITGPGVYADGVLALRRGTWDHPATATERPDPPGASGANAGHASLSNLFGAPMLGAVTRWRDLAVGTAFSIPFGGRSHWDQNPRFAGSTAFPLAAEGVQRWHSIQGALTFMYFTGGVAYRVGRFSFGVSGNLVRSSVHSEQAKNPTGNGDPDSTREGRLILDVRGYHASVGLGAMVEAIDDRLWLAASYQSQPGFGPMTLRGTLQIRYQESGGSSVPVTFTQALPDITRLGGRFRPSRTVELRLYGDFTRWSVLQSQCVSTADQPCAVLTTGADATPGSTTIQNVRRGWNNTVGVRAGGSLWVKPAVELFAGAGYETGAVPDATLEPGLLDADNVTGAAGVRVRVVAGLFVQASYTHVQYLNRDNTGRSQLAAFDPPTRRADGGGRYTLSLDLASVSVEKQF
jgi:long-chain fatty acid transport protein